MKSLLIAALLAVCALLSGCGTLNTYVATQSAMAIKDTQGANDNLVKGIEASICEVPIGAVIRNSEFVPIAQAACLPAGANQNPAQLMQNMAQPTSQVVPAYQQNMTANLVPTPVKKTTQKPISVGKPLFTPAPTPAPAVAAPAPTPSATPAQTIPMPSAMPGQ